MYNDNFYLQEGAKNWSNGSIVAENNQNKGWQEIQSGKS